MLADVLHTSPRDHGFEADAWDFHAAVAHLNNVAGADYSYKSGHRLLRKMGVRVSGRTLWASKGQSEAGT